MAEPSIVPEDLIFMNSEEDIFGIASMLPATERAAYLDTVCAGQPLLRSQVEALLRAHDTSGFMDSPPQPHPGARSPESAKPANPHRVDGAEDGSEECRT